MTKKKYSGKGFFKKILNLKIIVFLSNFIFQGITYMSFGEKIYKISITLLFSLPFYFLNQNIYSSIMIGHLINYILNGQFYVVFRYLSSKRTMSYNNLKDYLKLINKLTKIFSPKDILIIGSFSRGKMNKSSDLDIRLFHDSSFINSIKAYFMATLLRACGLIMKFPIDIFCFSDLKFLDKINLNEVPVNFLNHEMILNKYPTSNNYKKHIETLIIN